MKTKNNPSSHSPSDSQPMEDPFYGHSEWVDPEIKQTVSQEQRRSSQHRGKTIRRPQAVARTMAS